MGGINHQPCGKFLQNSTLLSRSVSCVGVSLESFNIQLEDEILANLAGRPVTLNLLWARAQDLKAKIQLVHLAFAVLSAQMTQLYYVDLPAANGFDYQGFGKKASACGMVNVSAYDRIVEQYKSGGFRVALGYMCSIALAFERNVDSIIATIDFLSSEKITDIANEFETNGVGNIRPEFAKMYTAWHDFHQDFLASSLISTEIFYLSESHGSLLVSQQAPASV